MANEILFAPLSLDRARRKNDPSKYVAIKEVRMEKEKDGLPITTVREIKLLSKLDHPNLVCLQEVAVGPVGNEFFLVFEYAAHDLSDILDSRQFVRGRTFSMGNIKSLLFQLLSAVEYLHSSWIIHRDIKLSNLLYFDGQGVVKLADFGLARTFSYLHAQPLTPATVTLWYRSPEILFDSFKYGPSADMWSVGCVFAELVLGKPLFPGESLLDQLNCITALLGSFESSWPAVDNLPAYISLRKENSDFSRRNKSAFIDTFKPYLCDYGLDLLDRLLQYDPERRITAAEALQHEFFQQEPQPTLPAEMPKFDYIHRKPPPDIKKAPSTP